MIANTDQPSGQTQHRDPNETIVPTFGVARRRTSVTDAMGARRFGVKIKARRSEFQDDFIWANLGGPGNSTTYLF